MNKLNHIESLLEAIRDDSQIPHEEKNVRYDLVDGCVNAYVKYHNTAVDQGASLIVQRFRMDFDTYAEYVARLHEQRKALHKAMIDHTIILNRLCAEHGVKPIYTGPMDASKGRDDPDTRFGVAAFGEEICRDLFQTTEKLGVPERAHEAYKDYAKRMVEHAGAWNQVQRMLAQAQAKSQMDAGGYHR